MTHDNIDILVVDDDISHCTILQALLRGWGYNVALANSGRQALEQARYRYRPDNRFVVIKPWWMCHSAPQS